MATRRRWSEDQRREAMAAHAQSGVSLWAFAKTAGIGYTTLTHWRDRERAGSATRLVPVQIEEPSAPASMAAPAAPGVAATRGSTLDVIVGGAVVRVGADFDDAVLLRVMRVLRAC